MSDWRNYSAWKSIDVGFTLTPSPRQTCARQSRRMRRPHRGNMQKAFLIDGLPESALRYREGWAVVAVDVIRATTMAVTAAALGRVCYPVDCLDAALRLARLLQYPLLAGEING